MFFSFFFFSSYALSCRLTVYTDLIYLQKTPPGARPADSVQHVDRPALLPAGVSVRREADGSVAGVPGGRRPASLPHPGLLRLDADRGCAAVSDLCQGSRHVHLPLHAENSASGLG